MMSCQGRGPAVKRNSVRRTRVYLGQQNPIIIIEFADSPKSTGERRMGEATRVDSSPNNPEEGMVAACHLRPMGNTSMQ